MSSLQIQQEVDLRSYNCFGVSAIAAEFVALEEPQLLPEVCAYADQQRLPTLILGGGSNILFVNDFPGLVIRMAGGGVSWEEATGKVEVSAGENWHEFVELCMNKGFHGLENLALIPGTTGAAPVQNIGAYGVELEQFVVSVTVYDRQQGEFRRFSHADCEFAYRDSIFKGQQGSRLTIVDMQLQLQRQWQPNISYQALSEALDTAEPSPRQLFDAVCQVRSSKLPDPAKLGNAGSFFKNPLISNAKYQTLLRISCST